MTVRTSVLAKFRAILLIALLIFALFSNSCSASISPEASINGPESTPALISTGNSVVSPTSEPSPQGQTGDNLQPADAGMTWEVQFNRSGSRSNGLSSSIPELLLFHDDTSLYLSSNSGISWRVIEPLEEINRAVFISAADVNPIDANQMLIATNFNGIWESFDGGVSWDRVGEGSQIESTAYIGMSSYDDFSYIQYDLVPGSNSVNIIFQLKYDSRLFYFDRSTGLVEETFFDELTEEQKALLPGAYEFIGSEFEDRSYHSIWPSNWPLPVSVESQTRRVKEMDDAFYARREAASDIRSIYMRPSVWSSRGIEILDAMEEWNMNAIVLDFKDDHGWVNYDSQVPLVREMDAQWPRMDAAEAIRIAHERGIYVIARLVVFKDKQLFNYNNNAYSFVDSSSNTPWLNYQYRDVEGFDEPQLVPKEYWVDAYSPFVHDYNISIAQELEELGVDEIQFDYIRFPSDGPVHRIRSRFYNPEGGEGGQDRVNALASFLAKARESLTIPIGVDVFGFNGFARTSYLGQDIEVFSHYVDVISPMSYPSHYTGSFYGNLSYLNRAYAIYYEGTKRAKEITGNRALIRQYVQAFLIGVEVNMDTPEYTQYLNRQIEGLRDAGGSGFSLWNNSGRYYMIDQDTFLLAMGDDETDSTMGPEGNS
jgi:hypothetical protein